MGQVTLAILTPLRDSPARSISLSPSLSHSLVCGRPGRVGKLQFLDYRKIRAESAFPLAAPVPDLTAVSWRRKSMTKARRINSPILVNFRVDKFKTTFAVGIRSGDKFVRPFVAAGGCRVRERGRERECGKAREGERVREREREKRTHVDLARRCKSAERAGAVRNGQV